MSKTDYTFELPKGYVDEMGNVHREVSLREITGADQEAMLNPQPRTNPAKEEGRKGAWSESGDRSLSGFRGPPKGRSSVRESPFRCVCSSDKPTDLSSILLRHSVFQKRQNR